MSQTPSAAVPRQSDDEIGGAQKKIVILGEEETGNLYEKNPENIVGPESVPVSVGGQVEANEGVAASSDERAKTSPEVSGLEGAREAREYKGQQATQGLSPMKIVVLCMGALALAVVINFVVTLAVIQATKDIEVKNGKLVSADSGDVLETTSSDLMVTDAGILASRQCLKVNGTCETPVSVGESKVHRRISSVIPDAIFLGLKTVELIATDQISKFYLDVNGIMRVETPGSKCGTVVNVFTNLGMLTFDDSDVLVDTELGGRLAETGFHLGSSSEINGTSGANLAGGKVDGAASGFFTFFKDFDRVCTPSAGPKFFEKPFMAKITQYHTCLTADSCMSIFRDQDGHNMYKAGYDQTENAIAATIETYESVNHILRLIKFPNYPTQTWVEVVHFGNSEHYSYTLDVDGTVHSCSEKKAPDSNLFDVDISRHYGAVFNGYKKGPQAKSLREFHLFPKEVSATPLPLTYAEFADDQKPYSIVQPNAKEMELDVETQVITEYSKVEESVVANFIAPYLDKVCDDSGDLKIRPLVKEDAFREDWPSVKHYLDQIDEEYEHLSPFNITLFPYDSVTTKYGTYWSTLLRMWHADENFYNEQAQPSSVSTNSSRRLQYTGSLAQEEEFPLKHDCKLNVGFGPGSGGFCFAVSSSSTCGSSAPGWYTSGQLGGCINGGSSSISGTVCLGYTWGVQITKKLKVVFWKKTISFGCSLSLYGCASVSTGVYNTRPSQRRRRRRRNNIFGATFGAKIGVQGGCDFGVKVSLEGDLGLTAGPCGSGLDMKGKLAISAKGCLKIGPFKGCIGFPGINILNVNLPDC